MNISNYIQIKKSYCWFLHMSMKDKLTYTRSLRFFKGVILVLLCAGAKERDENNFSKHLQLVGNGLCNFSPVQRCQHNPKLPTCNVHFTKGQSEVAHQGISDARTPPSWTTELFLGLEITPSVNYMI